jgi:transcriptional regulator with XRE-family HTH domain
LPNKPATQPSFEGKLLAEARERLGYSLQYVAERATDVSASGVRLIETTQARAHPKRVASIALVVEVTPEQLDDVGRPDAARRLERFLAIRSEERWRESGPTSQRLAILRDDLSRIIDELRVLEARDRGVDP